MALAADDPLAARTTLRLADLTGRTLPDGGPAEQEPLRAGTGSAPLPPGRQLDVAQIFTLVETGSIVWFPPVSLARRHPRPNIAYRTVADLPPSTLVIVWPQASRSPAVAAFVRAAVAIARDAPEILVQDLFLDQPIAR